MSCEQNYEDEGLTFAAIFRFIKKALPCVLVCLLVTVMIGVAACAILSSVNNDKKTVVQGAFELVYDGAEEGFAPDGTVLDVQKIKSASRVSGAIAKLGLDLSNDQLRSAISINGQYSNSIIALIASFEGDESKALAAVSKEKFYYTRYTVTIDIAQVAGLNGDNAALIINELLNEARDNELKNSNTSLFAPSSLYTEEFFKGANMLEVIDMAIIEIDKISSAAQNSKISAADKALVNKNATICNNKIMSLQREVFISGAFLTDVYTIDMVMSRINGYVSDCVTEIEAIDNQIVSINLAIDKMKDNAQIIVNEKGDVINGTYFLEVYQTMFNKLLSLSDRRTHSETTKLNYEKQLVDLQSLIDAGAAKPSDDVVASAKSRLVNVVSELKALAQTTEYLLDQQFVTGQAQGLVVSMAPTAVTIGGASVSWLKCIVISGIVGVLLGFVMSPILSGFIKKRRKAGKIMIASGDNTSSVITVDDNDAVENSTDNKPNTK